ncbi:DUF423 domain-containing protein [Agarivorans gilvus]|uniref:UPF0382 membrane protein n=1 Tax=Agarivorans gilvus TaxID=680279 RepID=A0ABQ1HZA9_9ALTE|nr:DUF423 domain-containing protein [Agarivorans gilvus]GGB01434.1 UPF0382 membrane protein [Agarivorans gilvus]
MSSKGAVALRVALAVSGAFCVVMGAGAAHGLSRILSESQLSWVETGVLYQLLHIVAALSLFEKRRLTACLWLVGGWLFAGSLYCLAFFGSKWFGPITPIGGVIMIIGWLSLAWSVKSKINE